MPEEFVVNVAQRVDDGEVVLIGDGPFGDIWPALPDQRVLAKELVGLIGTDDSSERAVDTRRCTGRSASAAASRQRLIEQHSAPRASDEEIVAALFAAFEQNAAMTEALIAPPGTDEARRAHDLLHACCEPHIAAHCERSFQFAALVARAEGVDVDLEVLYIGTLLHDVGLATRFPGPERFEMRGANAVRAMLVETDMDNARVEAVWDVIALHASTAIAAHKSVETRIANRGISIDVRGAGADRLAADAVRAVLDAWPRHEFPSAFSQTLIAEVRANPAAVTSSWMEHIAVTHVPEFQAADFLATLHSSEHFF